MSSTLLMVLLAGGAAGLLALLAAGLLAAEASRRDLSQRVQHAIRADVVGTVASAPTLGGLLRNGLLGFGKTLRDSTVFAGAAAADLERAVMGAGLDPRRAVPMAIAGKVLLLALCPLLAYGCTLIAGYDGHVRILVIAFAAVFGMLLPNWILGRLRSNHQSALRRGLPDALDLLVVCTEAGLGLESAVDRVAAEMRTSDPSIALEFFALGQELRITSDRAMALMNFAERTELEPWQRLARTLAQTLRYGTPLGQSLRSLASEMRNDRVMRMEEKAAQLPALMTMPMILFILPCLFIVLVGPSAIRVLNTLGN